jgi:hypothetical protein
MEGNQDGAARFERHGHYCVVGEAVLGHSTSKARVASSFEGLKIRIRVVVVPSTAIEFQFQSVDFERQVTVDGSEQSVKHWTAKRRKHDQTRNPRLVF